jgi:hypothetical protein
VFKLDDAGGTLRTLTAFLDNVTFSNSVDVADTTTMGTEVKTYLSGHSDATLSISGLYDSTATTGPDVVLQGIVGKESTSSFEYGPEGGSTGKVKISGEAFLTGYEINAAGGDAVKFTADFQVSGAVTQGAF